MNVEELQEQVTKVEQFPHACTGDNVITGSVTQPPTATTSLPPQVQAALARAAVAASLVDEAALEVADNSLLPESLAVPREEAHVAASGGDPHEGKRVAEASSQASPEASLDASPAASSPHEEAPLTGVGVAKVQRTPSEKAARYTSGLLTLLLRAYAKRNRPPPPLCACVQAPTCAAPCILSNDGGGHLSQSPEWETYVQRLSLATSHARNCEFSSPQRLQRHVLVLIQGAQEL